MTRARPNTILLDDGPPILTDRNNKRRTVVKRGFVVAVAGAAIVVAGLGGCSSHKASNGNSTAASGKGSAKVTVDGKDLNVSGDVGCTTTGDTVSLALGNAGGNAIGAVLSGGGKDVQSVALVLDNKPLAYTKGAGGDATVTKDGSKYTIKGHAVGMPDMSNPMAGPSNHEFSLDVTCP
jgi:lipoprotein LpqH